MDKERDISQAFSKSPSELLNIRELEAGDRINIENGGTAEIVENPRDGVWLIVRYLTYPGDDSKEGSEDMIFCEEVASRM